MIFIKTFFALSLLFVSFLTLNANPKLEPGQISAGSGYDSIVPLHWSQHDGGTISSYKLYRKEAGEDFQLIEDLLSYRLHYIDTTVEADTEYFYKINAIINSTEIEGLNIATAIPNGLGHELNIPSTDISIPTIDGQFSAGEWDDALCIDITNYSTVWGNNPESNTTAYLKFSDNNLYIAIVDSNDITIDDNDQIMVSFDFNNNNNWTSTDHDGKFNLVYFDGNYPNSYNELNGVYPSISFGNYHFNLEFVDFSIGEDNCVVYETRIDMIDEFNEIFAHDLTDNSFGLHIQVNSKDTNGNSSVTGMYPQNSIWSAPITFSNTSIAGFTNIENDNDEWLMINGELKQNYPNPFNPITKISYQLAVSSKLLTEIVVYNAMGQMVWSSPVTRYGISPVMGFILFDGSAFNSGIYYYSLIIDGKKIDTKSMILIK